MKPHRTTLLPLIILLAACGSPPLVETAHTVTTNDDDGLQEQTSRHIATSGGETTQSATEASNGSCSSGDRAARPVRPIYFDFEDAMLTTPARDQLAADARCIQAQGGTVEVSLTGAADPRGTEEYNLALGERRARAVRDYLVSLGVARGRLRVRSVGEEMANGDSEAGWARDRNVSQD